MTNVQINNSLLVGNYGYKNSQCIIEIDVKLINFNRLVRIEVQMSLNLLRTKQHSLQQSRVSSSSSSQSQSYELTPTQQPYFKPTRDVASPKASFPFRKVHAANQTANKKHNQSRSSIKASDKDVNQSKDLIQVTVQLNNSNIMRNKSEKEQSGFEKSINHAQMQHKIQQLRKKIEQLQGILEQQRNQYDLQRKANEIYTQGFQKIRELILSKCKKLEGESIQYLVSKLGQLLSANVGNDYYIIEEQDKKIRQLRAELLKSTQNNINAIFNTEITEAYCLQHQIQKMNVEIINLKQKLIKATEDNQQNITRMLQTKSNTSEIKKIIKIYQQRLESESDGDEISKDSHKSRTKKASKNKNKLKQSRQSSSSEKSHRNKRLKSTEDKISDLIDGYKSLRDEYNKLEGALRQINGSQTDFKELFSVLKKDITFSIQNQILQVKQTLKRPSSSHQQKRIAKEVYSKLNDLINTLNAPEKVNIQKPIQEEENHNWKQVETVRKISQLQAKNSKLQLLLAQMNQQKNHLQETIMNMSKLYTNKNRENQINQLMVESAQKIKKSSRKVELIDQFLMTSKSDIKQQHINQQLSVGQGSGGHIVHTSGFNKLHSSQSYHQSSSKNTQIQALYLKIQRYEEILREKQLRITQLQNTILDHIQSRAYPEPQHQSQKDIRQRYENYISNLKILLRDSQKQCEFLRKQLIKTSQMSLSRANNDQDRNSITLSDRTTKNCIAQTRLIQRRPPKTNSYQNIRAKIQIQTALERAFISLLQFGQKIILYQDALRITVVDNVINCIKQLILQAKQRNCKIYDETMNEEDIIKRLMNIGVQFN